MLKLTNAISLTEHFGEDNIISYLDSHNLMILKNILKVNGVNLSFDHNDMYEISHLRGNVQTVIDIQNYDKDCILNELKKMEKMTGEKFGSLKREDFTFFDTVININGYYRIFFKLFVRNGIVVPYAFHLDDPYFIANLVRNDKRFPDNTDVSSISYHRGAISECCLDILASAIDNVRRLSVMSKMNLGGSFLQDADNENDLMVFETPLYTLGLVTFC